MDENSCGFGSCRPKFLNRFANSYYFMLVYGLLGAVQAMSFVYFIATLSSLEKRFHIPSETMGILMTGNEISQILLSIYLAYRGGKGHRPLWLAYGVVFSAISCFILALPHWIYGAGENSLALTQEFLDSSILNLTKTDKNDPTSMTCWLERVVTEDCENQEMERSVLPLVIIFMSQFVLGIGTSLFLSLGQTYMDDNTKKKNTPLLLGITMSFRSVGPALGFILGYACLNVYIEPSLTPVISRRDPRWIGAWWLGWIFLGSAMGLFGFLMALFPKELPVSKKGTNGKPEIKFYKSVPVKETAIKNKLPATVRRKDQDVNFLSYKYILLRYEGFKDQHQDFFSSLKRILTNKLLISNNLAAVFYVFGAAGYISFYSKYAEVQFQESAAKSSMFAGVTTVAAMAIGFALVGFIITKFKPRTTFLLAYNVLVGFVYIAGQVMLMNIGCDNDTKMAGTSSNGIWNATTSCNSDCACDLIPYSPVCNEETQKTFYSACHAGCTNVTKSFSKPLYSNCSCLPDPSLTVKEGPCPTDCNANFVFFVGVQCFMQLMGCGARITTVLVNYRSVDKIDKSIAQGLALFLLSLFAFIPGPIVFGKIIDQACIVWDVSCGKTGNCWLYDVVNFRVYLNATAIAVTSIAVFLDIFVFYFGRKRNLNIYKEDSDCGQDADQDAIQVSSPGSAPGYLSS